MRMRTNIKVVFRSSSYFFINRCPYESCNNFVDFFHTHSCIKSSPFVVSLVGQGVPHTLLAFCGSHWAGMGFPRPIHFGQGGSLADRGYPRLIRGSLGVTIVGNTHHMSSQGFPRPPLPSK